MGLTNRVGLALIAGAVAITINILLLDLADSLGIVTARGGFQRLVKLWFSNLLVRFGIADGWAALGLPGPDTVVFKTGFKVAVGLIMAVGYAVVIEPRLPGCWWSKALVYAVLIWLVNALFVLPWLEEGIAGSRYLTPGGMAYFAMAHTAFFLVLAFLFGALEGGACETSPSPDGIVTSSTVGVLRLISARVRHRRRPPPATWQTPRLGRAGACEWW